MSIIYNLVEKQEFHHFYQPIYCLKMNSVIGYESLVRSQHITDPEEIFSKMKNYQILHDFDILSIEKTIHNYVDVNKRIEPLFINVFPSTLLHPSFQPTLDKLLSTNNIDSGNIVFEIVEEEANVNELKKVTAHLKGLGFSIAIDDLGKGSSSLRLIIELEPQFVKIDRYFSINLTTSPIKQKMVKTFVDFCDNSSTLILEGIENESDLSIAKSIGVSHGQGYLMGKPDKIENLLAVKI